MSESLNYTATIPGLNDVSQRLTKLKDFTIQFQQAESSFKESEDLLNCLIEKSLVGICILQNDKLVFANVRFAKLFGYGRNEILNLRAFMKLVNSQDKRLVLKKMRQVINDNNGSGQFTFQGIRKNGNVIECEVSLARTLFRKRPAIVATVLDVTRLKYLEEAEEALRESEQKYRSVVHNADEGIFVVQNDQIKFFNPKAAEIAGYEIEELMDNSFLELIDPEDEPGIAKILQKKQMSNSSEKIPSCRLVDQSGAVKLINMLLVSIKWQGQPAHLCFIRDITEQRKLQEELQRTQRLESAGRVAGQIAHDFNNLLSPLTAYPALIREEFEEGHSATEMLDEMSDSAAKLAEMNQQLLALGRRGHYSMEPVNLNNLIHKVIVSQKLPKDLRVKEEFSSDLYSIKGGAAQLTRAFINLMVNAKEASNSKGCLTVRTENSSMNNAIARVRKFKRGDYVKIEISDTGCGIEPHIMSKIFDPFFTTKKMDRRRGSGLGLSVVHGIIEDHNGYIDVVSEVKKGTTFTLYLPAYKRVVKEVKKVVETSDGGDEKILVVDDDPLQRRVAGQLLRRLGYKVRVLASGESAISHLKKRPYDLLIMDMFMKGMDGVETYKKILQNKPKQKAIILSGYAKTNRVREALKLGAGTFVSKPVTQTILANAVRRELDRNRL